MASRTLFRGVRLVDPAAGHDGVTDVLVEDESVAAVGPGLGAAGARVVEGGGLVMTPGLVDLHAHLREPGFEHKETVETATRAAAAGGFTALCAMPNTDPVADNIAVVAEVRSLAEKAGLCDVHPAGAITKGLEGEGLSEMGELAAAGVRLFTDDGRSVGSSRMMRVALEYSKAFDVVIMQHAQDEGLTEGWQMHEGYWSSRLGLNGYPAEGEEVVAARDVALARLTGGRLHLTHVSAARTVELIRRAVAGGSPLTADVTPHHLAITDEALQDYDTNLKVNPPLRSAEHRDALRAGLAGGVIGVIATDHAPHAPEEKEREFDQAPPGTTGLETALAVALTELVEPGMVDLATVVRSLTVAPAAVLRLDDQGGPVRPGRPANLTVFDPAAAWTVGERGFHSLGRNSAFTGRRLHGRVLHTMLRGTFTVADGEPTA